MAESGDAPAVGTRAVETGTALALAALGALAIWDSARIGLGWGPEGPRSGTFPFWIGLFLLAASAGNLIAGLRARAETFVTRPQAVRVAAVLLPTIVYVGLIGALGLYAASGLLVVWFMMALGGFAAWRAVPSGVAVAAVAYVVFERWFLVQLPKGPLEDLLGL